MDAAGWHSQIARQFDGRYEISRAFRERLLVWSELIDKYVSDEAVVLDAGCGSGVFSFVAGARSRTVLGIDASLEMIELCKQKKLDGQITNVEFRKLRLEQLDELEAGHFDMVLCSSVLEYVDEFQAALKALARRLKPGGILLLSVPNRGSLYRLLERAVFKATGRPRYCAFVQPVPLVKQIERQLAQCDLDQLDKRYYAATPVLSPLARSLHIPQYSDNLVVFACQRQQIATTGKDS